MRLTDKAARFAPMQRKIALAVFGLILMIQLVWGSICAMSKQVSIVDEQGAEISFITCATTVSKVLAERNITLNEGDEVTPALNERVHDGDAIVIGRVKSITLINGKEQERLTTAKRTVAEVLEQQGLSLGEGVRLNAELEDRVSDNMTIALTYVKEEVLVEEEAVPYNTQRKSTTRLAAGVTEVVQAGSDGVCEKTYKAYYENGDLVSKELLQETVTVAAVDEVVEYGERPRMSIAYHSGTISRGSSYRYKGTIQVTATAYCPSSSPSRYTATGIPARYGVVAVDPSVIPLGTRLYIEAADGSWTYGTAVAADTGGAVKGNKIDVFLETRAEAIQFGVRQATVYILE